MKLIRIHSHEGAATLHPRRYTEGKAAMIRMTTMPQFVPLVFRDDYVDVLELRFADFTLKGWQNALDNGEGEGFEEMKQQGHAMWLPTTEHATQIIEFVDKHHEQIDLLVVHCDAGVSRSSAVAIAMCEKYGLDDQLKKIQENKRYRPNQYIIDLLREHYRPKKDRQRLYDKLFNKDAKGTE